MALGLARDQSSDCTAPVLVFYAYSRGFLHDVESLEFQVYDISTPAKRLTPLLVWPLAPGRQAVDLAACDAIAPGHRLGLGRYVAEYTADTTEALGDHLIRWYVTHEAGDAELSYSQEFVVLPASEVVLPGMYCTLTDLRDEGLANCSAEDPRLFKAIQRASAYIDRITGRFFGPRYLTQRLNGHSSAYCFFNDPVIALESVTINSFPFDPEPDFTFSNESVRVYNRHIADGLLGPDDRNNPKIELIRGEYDLSYDGIALRFPEGQQNVEVAGVFGYTDPDGSTVGKIPDDIRHVCALLTLNNIVKLTDEARAQQNFAFRITQERTREQSVAYASPGGKAQSMIYGYLHPDPEINAILAFYMRPPALGAV